MSIINHLKTSPWFYPFRIALSVKYGVVIWLRNLLYDLKIFKTLKVKTPVISVGNISSGGSGKTILVQALLEYFFERNLRPAILSRGYGRSSKGLVVVADGKAILASISEAGDEPYLIANNFPNATVLVSEDRFKGADYLEKKFSPDVIILDDGFQHRRLHRDHDLVIIDFPESPRPHLLPWGNLRESQSNISRADIILYSKNGVRPNQEYNLAFDLDNEVYDTTRTAHNINELKGDFGVFAGIGKPAHFFSQVEAIHKPSTVKISLPDHAKYSKDQLDMIRENSCEYWITTQKDFIKLDPRFCDEHNIYFIMVKTSLPQPVLHHLKQYFN